MNMQRCMLCPRFCGADRTGKTGFCGAPDKIKLARAALHMWEEPPISGQNGSGAIFFSNCTLRCCFCQNYKISAEGFGKEISIDELCSIMIRLENMSAHNINFVTPTHYADKIAHALSMVRPHMLTVPTVYNCSGYETADTIEMMNGFIDVYLPDLKYFSSELSLRYSLAKDYFAYASQAVVKMYEQVGVPVFDSEGLLKKGVIIRHMVLPGAYRDSLRLLDWLGKNFDPDSVLLSLMCQYIPQHRSKDFPEIDRRVTTYEYNKVLERAQKLGFNGYMQTKSSAAKEFIPEFDLSGL